MNEPERLAGRTGVTDPLGTRIRSAIERGLPPVAVIVEPNAEILTRWALPDHPVGVEAYVRTLASACSGLVCLAKIQPAAFERFGPEGLCCLARSVAWLKAEGVSVVIDSKRADHAPVLRQLVRCYVGRSGSYGADGISLLPYLGLGEILAVAGECSDEGGLLLVILQTSNSGAALVQNARSADGKSVARALAEQISLHNHAAGRDELAVVVGGAPDSAARLLEGHQGLAVLPGWGRASVDKRALLAARSVGSAQTLISMGSYLTAHGPDEHRLRRALEDEIGQMRL